MSFFHASPAAARGLRPENLRMLFVGVDRYADPAVPDLSWASRDARSVAALFRDTIPGTRSTLLLDREATADRMLSALDEVFEHAGTGDVSVFFFSGHGTRDHRLAPHDIATGSRLSESTIPMRLLEQYFKACRAQIVVMVLDCCFSGGLAERVLPLDSSIRVIEETPATRMLDNPLAAFAGEGRVILTASEHTQPSYEVAGLRHLPPLHIAPRRADADVAGR